MKSRHATGRRPARNRDVINLERRPVGDGGWYLRRHRGHAIGVRRQFVVTVTRDVRRERSGGELIRVGVPPDRMPEEREHDQSQEQPWGNPMTVAARHRA